MEAMLNNPCSILILFVVLILLITCIVEVFVQLTSRSNVKVVLPPLDKEVKPTTDKEIIKALKIRLTRDLVAPGITTLKREYIQSLLDMLDA